MPLSPSQKGALTRKANGLRRELMKIRGDRGLWENVTPEMLERNRRFAANIEQQIMALERSKDSRMTPPLPSVEAQ